MANISQMVHSKLLSISIVKSRLMIGKLHDKISKVSYEEIKRHT